MMKTEARYLAAMQLFLLVVLVALNVVVFHSWWFILPVVLAGHVLGWLLGVGWSR